MVLRDRGAEQSWHIIKDVLHSMQELSVTRQGREETSMTDLRPAGQTKEQEGTAKAVEAGTGIPGRV